MSHMSQVQTEFRSLPYLLEAARNLLQRANVDANILGEHRVKSWYASRLGPVNAIAGIQAKDLADISGYAGYSLGIVPAETLQQTGNEGNEYPSGHFSLVCDPWGQTLTEGSRAMMRALGNEEFASFLSVGGGHVWAPEARPTHLQQEYALVVGEGEARRRSMASVRVPQANGDTILRIHDTSANAYVLILAKANGDVETSVVGVKGPSCLKRYAWLTGLLGAVTHTQLTAEGRLPNAMTVAQETQTTR